MIYSGVGSRKTPLKILEMMYLFAFKAAKQGHILRSGGALGADLAFENGVLEARIWNVYQKFTTESGNQTQKKWWMDYTARLHPAWDKCGEYARKLHARNVPIVLGENLNQPSDFIVCWTPNAAVTGGTGQTIRIAEYNQIEVLNLARPDDIEKMWGKLS